MKKKIVFYNDAAGYGGHEVMMLLIIREAVRLQHDIHLICSPLNRQVVAAAHGLEGLTVHILPFTLNRFNFITNALNLPKIGFLRRLLRSIAPDCVVAVQGNIEISSLVLPAARKEELPVISYMALAQTMRELGASLPAVRDAIDRYFLDIPDLFIITGESQRSWLNQRGIAARRICLIPNVVSFDPGRLPDRTQARRELGLGGEGFWFGLVARVVANHKGHNYLIEAVNLYRERFSGIRFLIVGDGPDLAAVQKTVEQQGLSAYFLFKPWMDDLNKVYAALDAVIMPSNHEGVPLIMIEAGLSGLPVVASDIDGMKDYLPPEWLFPRGDLPAMVASMTVVASADQSVLCTDVKKRFREIFLRQTIGREFLAELEALYRVP